VQDLYVGLLGRSVEPGGLTVWDGFLDSGGALGQVKWGVLGSPEFYDRSGGTDASFLQALYDDDLGRPPDPFGQATFLSALSAGVSRAEVARLIDESPEAESDQVTTDYEEILGRAPDPFGLAAWGNDLEQNGGDNVAISADLLGSNEFATQVTDALGSSLNQVPNANAWARQFLSQTGKFVSDFVTGLSNSSTGAQDETVTDLKLYDIPSMTPDGQRLDEPLRFLSISEKNPYYQGNTEIYGTIAVQGEVHDQLYSLRLAIEQGGVKAYAELSDSAKAALLGKPFGLARKLAITNDQLLFVLPNSEAHKIDVSHDGTVRLRVEATFIDPVSETLKSATPGKEVYGDVGILTLYTLGNRYGIRDKLYCIGNDGKPMARADGTLVECGGDDWVEPDVKPILEHFGGVVYNDFSNMNGGTFPLHKEHQQGFDVDVKFAGGSNGMFTPDRDAARTLIMKYLDDPAFGSYIKKVVVSFTPDFEDEIQGVRLIDGRLATKVFLNDTSGEHDDHFHWQIDPTLTPQNIDNTADLKVTVKADPPSQVQPGDIVTYTVTATNQGPLYATGVMVNLNLPDTLTFVSATSVSATSTPLGTCSSTGADPQFGGNTITCTLGATDVLHPANPASNSVTMTVKAMANTTGPSPAVVRASVMGNETDPDLATPATSDNFAQVLTAIGLGQTTYTGRFDGSVVDLGNSGCPGRATLGGDGSLQVTQASDGTFRFSGTVDLVQDPPDMEGGGICDSFAGLQTFSGTVPTLSGGVTTFTFGPGTATGTFNGSQFTGTWSFSANEGPDNGTGTFSFTQTT
jgi:uncharacterized repeat protein (TIGR01451 family)